MQITTMTIGVPATRRPHGRWSNLRLALSNYPPLGIIQRWRKTPTPLPCRLTTVPRRRPTPLRSPPDNPASRRPRVLGLGSENTNDETRNTGCFEARPSSLTRRFPRVWKEERAAPATRKLARRYRRNDLHTEMRTRSRRESSNRPVLARSCAPMDANEY